MKTKHQNIYQLVGTGNFSCPDWLASQGIEDPQVQDQIEKACRLASAANPRQTRLLELDSLATGLEIAGILNELKVDGDTLCAAILVPALNAGTLSLGQVEEALGPGIAKLAKGACQMDAIRDLQKQAGAGQIDRQQVENLRRMLLAMVDDARSVLVKLAERVSFMRQIKNRPAEFRERYARETEEIYAPLANRLGIGQIKWELEDLSFRYLHSDSYKNIARQLKEKRASREVYIERVIDLLQAEMTRHGIKAEVSGRVKHIYSIWRKMERKQVDFDEIYDTRAVRIMAERIPDCYAALGCIHGLWQHVPKEFDDYIATPKANGYRSLHTAVLGPEGKILEVQIRTRQMHEEAERGVAAHWAYKEGSATGKVEDKIAWLRQLLEWQKELVDVADPGEMFEEFRSEIVNERSYVFTPDGKVVDLPVGSTPLDFAYHIHTEIGHRCRGAKVNGRIVPLNTPLHTGEKVEILTRKQAAPSRDWLSPHQGYVTSSRARNKIRQWFRYQDREENAHEGKLMLEKEFARVGLQKVDLDELARQFNLHNEEELHAGVGAGDLRLHQVVNKAEVLLRGAKPARPITPTLRKPAKSPGKSGSDVTVEGVGDLLTSMAGCCKPVPGEAIIGYITKSRGIAVHRKNCTHIERARNERPERLLEVQWQGKPSDTYLVDLLIKAYDRQGLLRDITTILANEKIPVTSLNTRVIESREQAEIELQVEITELGDLSKLMTLIGQLPNVFKVGRLKG